MTQLRWGSSTDTGLVRSNNQDSFLIAEPLFAVADGMGGANGGEVASATALEVLQASFTDISKDGLLEAVRRANAKVWDKAQLDENLHGMGTTLTLVAKLPDHERNSESLAVVNVGDSRGYLLRDGELTQLTTDHSLVEELVQAGEITPEEAETHPRRNMLTRALGVEPTVEADLQQLVPQVGDRILLCSDGLVREVTDDVVAATLRRLRNPDEAARELVQRAKTNGGHDNITVVIVDVEADGNAVPPTAPTTPRKEPKKSRPARAPKERKPSGRLTFRMFLFFLALLALVAVAVGSVWWYARSSFYVGVEGEQVTIYRGRPEDVLWFEATVAARTNISLTDVLPSEQARLREGATQSSREDAESYILNLVQQAAQARQVADPNAAAAPDVIFEEDTSLSTTTSAVPDTTPSTDVPPAQ